MKTTHVNPFLSPFATLHGTVPFSSIRLADYEEAIRIGIEAEQREIDAIASNPEPPTFSNTILALERSGEVLERATTVLFNLVSANTKKSLDRIAERVTPILSQHSSEIMLNAELFARVKAVYDAKPALSDEDQMLLEKTYEGFERSGATLDETGKKRFRAIREQLSQLTLRFSQNHLKATNDFVLHLTEEADLDGLPQSQKEQAQQAAQQRGLEGWVITLHAPSYGPFMMYATRRELRRKLYVAYNTQCTEESKKECNFDIVRSVVNLRLELAQLLGYRTYAEYVLRRRMAETPAHVYRLLDDLQAHYMPVARREVDEVEQLAKSIEGADFKVMPWDFAFYAHRLKMQRFDLDPETLRPYLSLERVKQGVFGLAQNLYGISFRRNRKIKVYHKDVEAYEVFDADGRYLAVLYADFFPRKGKQSGAWMTNYKDQWIDDATGMDSRPHVSLTTNFTPPIGSRPSLLTLSEVETFLHEFGHCLHGIFAATRRKSLSGTSVYWDFVELPSQFMENYATEKEFLHTFAYHYETGEPLPDELIDRIVAARNFNVGYACMRQVSFGLLDMAYYNRSEPLPDDADVRKFEHEAWRSVQLLPQVDEACMSVQFGHIMSGGYSAGYYSYKWAEVLDADAFAAFKEEGIFNAETARRFRECVLSRGGTRHPAELYRAFRGKEPSIEALMQRDGIKQK